MIKSIKLYNRFNMEVFANTGGLNFPYKRWYLVSIYGETGKPLINAKSKSVFESIGMKGFISLNFWDLDEKYYLSIKGQHPEATLFNKGHASKIISLLDKAREDTKNSVLVVHCQAGISRSGAVGTFACDYCKLDYDDFIKENYGIHANQHVLNILRRKANFTPYGMEVKDGIDWEEIKRIGLDRFDSLVLKRKK